MLQCPFSVAGATVGASLIVTGATFGDVAVSLFCGRGNCCSVTLRDRGHIW